MKIPIPCEFGNYAECNNRQLPFSGVSWFKWTEGMEYTYFFDTNDKWDPVDFYTTFDNVQPLYLIKSSINLNILKLKTKKGRRINSSTFFHYF